MKISSTRMWTLLQACLPAFALALLASPNVAQWDVIPRDQSNSVFIDSFILIHENASGINAFSAAAQKWTTVSPVGSTMLGYGDWTMLTEEPGDVYRGYSARRHSSASITVSSVLLTMVDDDVSVVIENGLSGPIAHAYSAVFNKWKSMPLTSVPTSADVAISRFVVAIRDQNLYHGFAARTGAWDTLTVAERGDVPSADGNTVLVNLRDPMGGGVSIMAAFSGVRGIWALSPLYFSPPFPRLDHNVAYVRVIGANNQMTRSCAYSAYNATWVASTVDHSTGSPSVKLSDNIVQIRDSALFNRYEAFGARPGNWASISGSYGVLRHNADTLTLRETPSTKLAAFSGVCGGTWVLEPTSSGSMPIAFGTTDHIAYATEGGVLHTFNPSVNVWTPTTTIPSGSVITVEDSILTMRGANFSANSTRWGNVTTGPPVPAASFKIVKAGNVIAHQQTSGAGIGDIYVYNERTDEWDPPFNPGGVPSLRAGRNMLITAPGGVLNGTVYAYSVQRGDWSSPPGSITTPLAIPSQFNENVGFVADGLARLWGFASPNTGHAYNAWPSGTEFNVAGPAENSTTVPRLGYSIKGVPATTGAYALVSSGITPPTILLPYAGFVCIDLSWFVNIGFFGITDSDCLRQRLIRVPNPIAGCVQFWLQPLSLDIGTGILTWEDRCDPLWFF